MQALRIWLATALLGVPAPEQARASCGDPLAFVEHYGLHGTPEPSRIGHTQSHGCVRLTNWDAARVAEFVAAETPVIFR